MNLETPKSPRTDRPLNITIKHIKAFLAAIECKSFSAAALQVFQSQPAFSRCIQELESELGEAVFTRTPQGVGLSEHGAAFLPHARQLLASYAEAQTGMAQWRAARQAKLSLVGCSAVMHKVLANLLQRLQSEFSSPSLRFAELPSAHVVQRVLAGTAALGVCSLACEQPDLLVSEVLETPLGILVAPDCPLPSVITDWAALQHLVFIRFADDSVVSQMLRNHGIALEPYFESQVESCGVPGSFALVRMGNMAMIATGFSASHPQAADLRFVPLPGLLPSIKASVISRRDNAHGQRQLLMKELVRESILAGQWHPSVRRVARKPAA